MWGPRFSGWDFESIGCSRRYCWIPIALAPRFVVESHEDEYRYQYLEKYYRSQPLLWFCYVTLIVMRGRNEAFPVWARVLELVIECSAMVMLLTWSLAVFADREAFLRKKSVMHDLLRYSLCALVVAFSLSSSFLVMIPEDSQSDFRRSVAIVSYLIIWQFGWTGIAKFYAINFFLCGAFAYLVSYAPPLHTAGTLKVEYTNGTFVFAMLLPLTVVLTISSCSVEFALRSATFLRLKSEGQMQQLNAHMQFQKIFFAKVTHDLKTPAYCMRTCLSLLRDTLSNTEEAVSPTSSSSSASYVDVMSSSLMYMLNLIHNLLDISRIQMAGNEKRTMAPVGGGKVHHPPQTQNTKWAQKLRRKFIESPPVTRKTTDMRVGQDPAGNFLNVECSKMNLHQCIRQSFEMNDQMARLKGLDFQLDGLENLPEFIFGDSTRILQALNNILSNSVKYTNKGSVLIRCYCETKVDVVDSQNEKTSASLREFPHLENFTRDKIVIVVKDTGRGISAESLANLFEDFVQADKSDSQCGTGLGLGVARHVLRLMGGDCSIKSDGLGCGSEAAIEFVAFSLPPEPKRQSDDRPISPSSATDDLKELRRRGGCILHADDDFLNRLVFREVLKRLAWPMENFLQASDGNELVDQYRSLVQQLSSPDTKGIMAIDENAVATLPVLIFSDLEMPNCDGLQAAEKVRRVETSCCPAYLVLASAHTREEVLLDLPDCESFFNSVEEKPLVQTNLGAAARRFVCLLDSEASSKAMKGE